MKKTLLTLGILGSMAMASPAQAAWFNATSCLVSNLRYYFWNAGNTGNFNMANLEELTFQLSGCTSGTPPMIDICVEHPEMGPVKNPGCLAVPKEVLQSFRETAFEAKVRSLRVNVSGDTVGSVFRPVYITLP